MTSSRAIFDAGFQAVPSDGALVSRALSGERDAFGALVERHGERVFRICMAMTKDRDMAEDCFQQVFLLACQRLGQFRSEAQFSTWLTRIAINAVLSRWRRRRTPAFVSIPPETEDDVSMHLRDKGEDPEARCYRGQLRKLLENAIQTLAPRLRIVFLLREVEELSIEDTARVLGISEAAVKTRLLRARLKMRDQLAPLLCRGGASSIQPTLTLAVQ